MAVAGCRTALAGVPDLLALQRADPALFPCLLQSAAVGGERGRYDLLLVSDGRRLRLDASGVTDDFTVAGGGDGFLAALDAAWQQQAAAAECDSTAPYRGGWALYLGYEVAAEIEPVLQLPPAPGRLPKALAWRCPLAVVVDHRDGSAEICGERVDSALWQRLQARLDQLPTATPVMSPGLQGLLEDAPERYIQGVRRALEYIAAGDVFQVNLSRGWSGPLTEGSAADCFAALCRHNPAPFAALFHLGAQQAVISSSPERLVARRGRRLETRPIAGTRPRFAGDDDAARMRELVGNPKERAEHIMLIDLERNDLGRVCEAGSVRVDELMAVETYAHVHHIESTVSGTVRAGTTPAALIRAVFPGGTITGCPKVRCMQIIAELEGVGRGPYTGALGWLGHDGDLDLNILIRTLWLDGAQLRFRAGAGVVADSDPQAELLETAAKARGLLRALGVDPA